MSWAREVDLFDLELAAVECARLLENAGWRDVFAERVLADRDGVEQLEPLRWRG